MSRTLVHAFSLSIVLAGMAEAQTKPVVTTKDYGKWESLGFGTRLSPRGDWLAYGINRVNEENELRIYGRGRDTTIVVPYASAPAFGAGGTRIVYSVGVSPAEREKLQKERKPVRTSLGIRNLQTGETSTVSDIASFAMSPEGRFVAMRRYPAEGKQVADIIVHDLSNGVRLTFGNVSEFAWSESQPLLAFVVEVEGGAGNGVQLYDAARGTVRTLESSPTKYRGLAWRPKSDDVGVFRAIADKDYKDSTHAILMWTGTGSGGGAVKKLEPASASLPEGTRIAEYRNLSWSKDGGVLFFGVRPRERIDAAKALKSTEKVSDVEIWHPNDVRVLQGQKLAEQRDLRATMLMAWRVGDGNVVPIGTDVFGQANPIEGGRFGVEIDTKPYPWGIMFGRRYQDVWVVDLTTGQRRKALEKVRDYIGASPTGQKIAWFDGKDYWVQDIASGNRTNLTATLTGKQRIDFTNVDDDHPSDLKSPWPGASWSKGDVALLVYDEYDIWSLALDGSGGRRLTNGAADRVVHRFGNPRLAYNESGLDLSQPQYLSLTGKWTKQSGYARLVAGKAPERLVFSDAGYRGLTKADSADVFLFGRERYDESPNWYLAGPDLATPKQVSNTNPFQKDYAWGKAELFDYKSTIGRPLQAILYYPANYDPSKKYPMVVYTYERLTQQLHNYVVPNETPYNVSAFVQNGYFVLLPDIVFRPREPGIAVLHSVEPAVRAVLARGLVDPARVGHCGHSQGGYEAAYLGTHSKLFATTVSGAGITDMISFAGQMHWGSGNPELDHWETGQFRMEVAPWEDFEAMLANSPLNKVHEMPAKSILIEIGGDDGVVDMRQGVLFYNYARRAGKHVVGSSRVDLQACKLEYSIVSPK